MAPGSGRWRCTGQCNSTAATVFRAGVRREHGTPGLRDASTVFRPAIRGVPSEIVFSRIMENLRKVKFVFSYNTPRNRAGAPQPNPPYNARHTRTLSGSSEGASPVLRGSATCRLVAAACSPGSAAENQSADGKVCRCKPILIDTAVKPAGIMGLELSNTLWSYEAESGL